jgi:hypothetical protein
MEGQFQRLRLDEELRYNLTSSVVFDSPLYIRHNIPSAHEMAEAENSFE